MKIKLDENLPLQLASVLRSLGHDVHTTQDESLVGQPDDKIWEATQRESRFLITQDLDFSDLRKFAPGSHHGILLLRLRWASMQGLIMRIEELFDTENVSDWAGCFIVATAQKVRVLRAESK